MSKTHAPANLTRYAAALESGDIARTLMLKAACGARATDRAQLLLSPNPHTVDCARCLKSSGYRLAADAWERNHPAPVAELEEAAPAAAPAAYAAQINRGAGWATLATADHADTAAWALNDDMQRAGFRFSELLDHRADLAAGHVLTADTGHAFRVVGLCDNPEAEHPGFSCGHPVAAPELEEAVTPPARCGQCGRTYDPARPQVHWDTHGHTPRNVARPLVGRPPVGKLRTVRVSDEVWAAAASSAAARGESVSEVIRRALELYVNAFPADITPGVTR